MAEGLNNSGLTLSHTVKIRLSPHFDIEDLIQILLGCGLIKFYESYYNMKYYGSYNYNIKYYECQKFLGIVKI